MRKIILLIFMLPLLLSTTCRTKKMVGNTITVENKLDKKISLVPLKIKYDFYDIKFTKEIIINNYSIQSMSDDKIFKTPFCLKKFWDRTVIGDTLEILVFDEDALNENETLNQLISNGSYIRKIKLTHTQLSRNNCRLTID